MASIAIGSSRQVPVSHLVEGPNPWREKNPKTDDLEESLARAPMLAPIVVRAMPGKRARFEVIAGHRRLKAARARGWSHVEVRIVAASDEVAEMLSLEENLRRRAVKNEPRALARLLELYNEQDPPRRGRPKMGQVAPVSGVRKVAAVTGKSPRDVRRLVQIGKAAPDIQQLYADGRVNVLEAERLARLKPDDQQRQLKLLRMPKVTEHTRAIEALKYALKNFRTSRPHGRVRREAMVLVRDLHEVLE